MTQPRQAIIALGSNLGDRRDQLRNALDLLRASPGIESIVASPVYETAPVGVTDQPSFLNMVAGLDTTLTPEELMKLLLETEQTLGRIRGTRWGPRIIDLDLLFFEQEKRHDHGLTLPHPRWAERGFVTVPLQALLMGPMFDTPAWRDLRQQVQKLPPDPDVRPTSPL